MFSVLYRVQEHGGKTFSLIKCKWEVVIDFPNVLILYLIFFVYAYCVFVDSCPCSDVTVLCYSILSDNNNDSPGKWDRRKQATSKLAAVVVAERCAIATAPWESPLWGPERSSLLLLLCCCCKHSCVSGILHCLVWKILWKMARDKLCMHCSICLEKENLEFSLVCLPSVEQCWKKGLCVVTRALFLASRKLLFCSLLCRSISFWFIQLLKCYLTSCYSP